MTHRILIAGLFAALALSPLAASPAAAQDLEAYLERQRDLSLLSSLFGELHHIRRTCEPRYEADIWRDRMKKLITLEEPEEAMREKLVAQFNDGYRRAQRRFPGCSRDARDYAAARAATGDAIIRRLTASLEEEEPLTSGAFRVQPDGTGQ